MSAVIALVGPVLTPGAPQITPLIVNAAVNAALAADAATAAAAVAAETVRATAAETANGTAIAGEMARAAAAEALKAPLASPAFTGTPVLTGATPVLSFAGSTSNLLHMSSVGIGAPTFNTRSIGTKVSLYDSVGAGFVDYAIGVASAALWFSVPQVADVFAFYAGITQVASISGTGGIAANSITTTGVSNIAGYLTTAAAASMFNAVSNVTTAYGSSGAIALTDLLSITNASSAVTMTVANGGASPIQLQINNLGAGAATISATINGGANTVTLQGAPNSGSLTLRWLPSPYSTWIII
jgi:hypothetical protein